MNTIKTFRDVTAWQKSMILVNKIYRASDTFPDSEQPVLTTQIRKSATTIASTLAKAHAFNSSKAKLRCLTIVSGLVFELQTFLEIAVNLGYINKEFFDLLYEDSRDFEKMLGQLKNSLD
ncbi:MAG: four helix bundle protein [Balneolaceae bacterium]